MTKITTKDEEVKDVFNGIKEYINPKYHKAVKNQLGFLYERGLEDGVKNFLRKLKSVVEGM